jgi:HEPN domain-containing protein
MDALEKYEYWLEHALYDMKAAGAMLNAGMWIYAIFMCQQAIEKLTKGLYGIFINADNVPRVHNVAKLVKEFENELREPVKDEYYDLMDQLSSYYLSNRYPDFKTHLAVSTEEGKAREIFAQSKEVFAWLQTLKP